MLRILMHINYIIFLQHYEEKMWVDLPIFRQQILLQHGKKFIMRSFQDLTMCTTKDKAIVALKEMKQWKHETIEDYYDNFLQLCATIT